MKLRAEIIIAAFAAATLQPLVGLADNPVVQTCYTADPAPMVYNDTVYLYTGHDEDNSTWFTMKDWRCFSSIDMVNWTDRGTPLSLNTFSWATSDAWAGQCIPRNGKFYWYVPVTKKTGGMGIGVAVSDKPTGPFVDALGHPLVTNSEIDPTVFIDDDGQAYLYWGNPNLFYVKLNEDMISYSGSVVQVPLTTAGFGVRTGNADRSTQFEEAPWLYKRNGLYYMLYAAGGVPEHIAYSTGPSATGPWTYQDTIMPLQGGSFTNHQGIIDYKGNSYFFYHNGALPGGGGFTRSVCVEQFKYNADGTFPRINMTANGIEPVENLNPYKRTEAEAICWESGVETAENSTTGGYVTDIDKGDYIKVKSVDFGTIGAGLFTANVACGTNGGTVELRLDSKDGALIGTLPVCYTGGENVWKDEITSVSGATGIHDLYLVFKGNYAGKILNMNNWVFTEKKNEKQLAGINATTDGYKLDIVSGSNSTNYHVTAVYRDGSAEDVTAQVQAVLTPSDIVSVQNGTVTGLKYGTANAAFTYGGIKDSFPVVVKSVASELTVSELTVSTGDLNMLAGNSQSFAVIAEYLDGHTQDVTLSATYENPLPAIVELTAGVVKAKTDGDVTARISYKGELGDAKYVDFKISARTFPLTQALFNPSIWTDGTFNESTLELKTGQYGFGGWQYGNGVDLSGYKYLVATLAKPNTCGASLNIFDENNYWSAACLNAFNSKTRVVVELSKMTKKVNNIDVALDPKHIYIVGFWTFGNAVLTLKDIYLTNSDTYEKPMGVESVLVDDPNALVDVYSLMGFKIRSQVKRSEAQNELPTGLYIIGNQKVFINRK